MDTIKHIVAATGDGARAMVKFGRQIEAEYVQCNDHGVHLGVTQVLYKLKPNNEDDESEDFFVECEDENAESDNEEVDARDTDEEEDEEELEMILNYHPTIKKMRKIIGFFHHSAVKNEILQKFVKRINERRELKLKMDSKTRWGSLYDACERFLKLIEAVKEALRHKDIAKGSLWMETDTDRLKVSYS